MFRNKLNVAKSALIRAVASTQTFSLIEVQQALVKAGTEYQELVAEVVRALDSNAKVETGQLVIGPDGGREVDVEVRGTQDGRQYFILIECKDKTYGGSRRRVGIGEIDALDSKRRDVNADLAVLCSNTGFAAKALRKAGRVGIVAISILAHADGRAKFVVERDLFARGLSVDRWTTLFELVEDRLGDLPAYWSPTDVFFDGLPIVNWLEKHSHQLLLRYPGMRTMRERIGFSRLLRFTIKDAEVDCAGFVLTLFCSHCWLRQKVREDLTLGYFNHISELFTIPAGQSWSLGPIDQ
ncbi:MAG: restriction endonuclease, partial [Pyrinomonadaceae bacterium]